MTSSESGELDQPHSDVAATDAASTDAISTDAAAADAEAEAPARPTMLDQMGGPAGMLDSGLPVVVFVVVNAFAGLTPGIISALAAGVLIAVFRLVRRKPVTQAIGGLFAVGIAAYIAHRMGSARGYFIFGIWVYLIYGGALLLSILVRWPLIGVLWESLNGRGSTWRSDRKKLYRYDLASLVWVAVFATRYLVQKYLYDAGSVGWLATARIVMGYPLFLLAIVATVLIVGSALGISVKDLWRNRGNRGQSADGVSNANGDGGLAVDSSAGDTD